MTHARTRAGFTLSEIMIAVAILRIGSVEYIAPPVPAEYLPASCRI